MGFNAGGTARSGPGHCLEALRLMGFHFSYCRGRSQMKRCNDFLSVFWTSRAVDAGLGDQRLSWKGERPEGATTSCPYQHINKRNIEKVNVFSKSAQEQKSNLRDNKMFLQNAQLFSPFAVKTGKNGRRSPDSHRLRPTAPRVHDGFRRIKLRW